MNKLKVGLALGGGGAKGFAHLGVIKKLHKHKDIEIVQIAGTSMGSLIGCGYAYRNHYDLLEKSILEKEYLSFIKSFLGLIKFDFEQLHSFCNNFLEGANFSHLKIPVNVIATDIKQMRSTVINTGNIATAITASSLTPYIHSPYKHGELLLVDGGITNLLPLEHANTPDVDVIIGVDVSGSRSYENQDITLSKMRDFFQLTRITSLFEHSNLSAQNEMIELKKRYINKPIYVLVPNVESISNVQFNKTREAIFAGEQVAELKMDEITSLL